MGSGFGVSSPTAREREPEAEDHDELDAREAEAEAEREAVARGLDALGAHLLAGGGGGGGTYAGHSSMEPVAAMCSMTAGRVQPGGLQNASRPRTFWSRGAAPGPSQRFISSSKARWNASL